MTAAGVSVRKPTVDGRQRFGSTAPGRPPDWPLETRPILCRHFDALRQYGALC
jgi:hypothetical protein